MLVLAQFLAAVSIAAMLYAVLRGAASLLALFAADAANDGLLPVGAMVHLLGPVAWASDEQAH